MLPKNIAKHLRELHSGGNWTCSNLKDTLSGLSWKQVTTQVQDFNSIATLVFHINYYICAVTRVLEGKALDASDKLSFEHPPINSQQDWEELFHKTLRDGEHLATLIEQLPENRLWETFTDDKYGIYFRNLLGIIEHGHYHLGQIALLKKLVK